MSDSVPSDKPTIPEPSAAEDMAAEVPFGSNAVRLTARQWLLTAAIVLAVLAVMPAAWSRIEPLDAALDYRVPHSLSDDYWLYQRYVRQAGSKQQVVVVGDSVIWGEYVESDQTLPHALSEQIGGTQFANGGLNGGHPLALAGLVQHYARSLHGTRVVVLCNLGDVGPFAPGRIADALRECAVADAAPAPAWPEDFPPAEPWEDVVAEELLAYVGHYRSHSPWTPGFHVLGSGGGLALRLPSFEVVPLVRSPDGTFGVDDEIEGPARIEFGDLIEGRAALATCDGVELYRVGW